MDTFPTPYQSPDLLAEPAHPGSDVECEELLCREEPLSPMEVLPAPKPAPKKPKQFRQQAMNFILTYPQCDVKKEVAAERIEQKFGERLKGYVVCEEAHKDGTPHLHVFLTFHEKLRHSNKNYFDFITGKHGSYEVVRNVRKSIEYVTKSGNYLAKGVDVDSIIKRKAPLSTSVAQSILEGKSISEINKENPGYYMINKRKIDEYESWVKCENSKKSKIDWISPSLDGLTDANLQIATWISKNIRQTRIFKAPQLYIHGPRNLGKTSLVEWLEKSLSVYHMPTTEEFYDHYSDDYDLVVIDEFKGQKTIQFLNQFLQGSTMPIRKKGSQAIKSRNLPVVILSNYSLNECYVKASLDGRLNTLECRLEIVEIDSFIDFYKRHDDII